MALPPPSPHARAADRSITIPGRQETVLIYADDPERTSAICADRRISGMVGAHPTAVDDAVRILVHPDACLLVVAEPSGDELMVLDHARRGFGSEQVPIVCLLTRKHRPCSMRSGRADDVIWGDPILTNSPGRGCVSSAHRSAMCTIRSPAPSPRRGSRTIRQGARTGQPADGPACSPPTSPSTSCRVDSPPRVESARRVACPSGATHQAARPQARLRRMASRHGRDPAAVDPDQGCPDSFRLARAQDLPPGVRDRWICDSPHAVIGFTETVDDATQEYEDRVWDATQIQSQSDQLDLHPDVWVGPMSTRPRTRRR